MDAVRAPERALRPSLFVERETLEPPSDAGPDAPPRAPESTRATGTALSVIIPANDEERWIGRALDSLVRQRLDRETTGRVEVIVVANGCTDDTVAVALERARALASSGMTLLTRETSEASKAAAMDLGDSVASGPIRAYLDADVVCGPRMLAALHAALDTEQPRYATGRLRIEPARSWITRCYARTWSKLPFMETGVPGVGLYAVNGAGRRRWSAFPRIFADDSFVRLLFARHERLRVPEDFTWPLAEGWSALVRVRRRQNLGSEQLRRRFPELLANDDKEPLTARGLLRLAARMPVSLLVYVGIVATARLGRPPSHWSRGR